MPYHYIILLPRTSSFDLPDPKSSWSLQARMLHADATACTHLDTSEDFGLALLWHHARY